MRIGLFIELHVEQGRGLIDLDEPVAVASTILAHGRWQLRFTGEGNHAGATLMTDRRDPMIAAARTTWAIRDAARAHPGSRATVGRIDAVPGGTNVIARTVTATLDVRAETDDQTRALVDEIGMLAQEAAHAENCAVRVTEESWSSVVYLDHELRTRVSATLGGIPALPTGAGHDAGVLASVVPSAMLFVRNPTGVSHSPDEFAELDDCLAGVGALETVLRELLQ